MKHLKRAEQKLSNTSGFRWTFGVLRLIPQILLGVLMFLWRRVNFVIMAAAFIGIIVTYAALDGGAINYTCAIMFVGILLALFATTIKILILESKQKKKDR